MNNFTEPNMPEILGGNQTFKFIPLPDVSSVPEAVAGIITSAISLVGGKQWFTGYASPGSLELTESFGNEDAGPVNSVAVKGFYPDAGTAMLALFESMVGYPFLVQITDQLGNVRLAGTYTEPLKFTFTRSTRLLPGERPGYEFTFSGRQKTACYIYYEPTVS